MKAIRTHIAGLSTLRNKNNILPMHEAPLESLPQPSLVMQVLSRYQAKAPSVGLGAETGLVG